MKKLLLLTKTLLAVALLCVGQNAWGDPTLVYGRAVTADLENGYTAWSASDIGEGKWVASSGTASIDTENNRGLKVARQRGSALATNSSQISVTAGYIVTIDAVWNTGYASGGDNENNAFTIGNNIEIRAYTYNQKGCVYINGSEYATITNACIKDNNREHDPWTIHLVVNTGTNKITEFTIRGANGTNKATYTLDGTISLNAGSTYNSLTLAHNRTKGNNAAEACYLTSVKITEEAQTLATADVTFKYAKTDGTSLTTYRADEVASGVTVGTDISSLISTYGTTFYNGTSNKYVYSSYSVTGDYTTVQEGGNTVTLKYTDYPATAYTVKAQASGSDLTTVASGTAYLDGSTTAYYSKYVKHSNQWYETSSPYGVAVSNATTNVAYTAYAANDIYDVIECENTTYTSAGDNTSTGNSNGKSVLLNSGSAMKTTSKIAAGIYDFSVYNIVRRANADQLKLQYSTNGTDWTDVTTLTFPSNDGTTQTAAKVVLAEDSYVRFLDVVGQNSCHYYDYILIKKFVPITPANNKSTYVTTTALDFTNVAGLDAYVATAAANGSVTLEEVGAVPAGTPLMLIGTAGTEYSVPVVASASAPAVNMFLAGDGTSNLDSEYNYILYSDGLFYRIEGGTVATTKAYLHCTSDPTTSLSRELCISFGGVTSVENVEAAAEAKAKEGKFIENGKLVIVKNGQKFNAAGAKLY